MGIVLKESYKNTVTLLVAILVGAINTLFLYVYFLDASYYGLITFVLSTAFILKPLIALGVNFSIVKFFSAYTDKENKDKFLSLALWQPLLVIVPLGFVAVLCYEYISTLLSEKNPLVKDYTYLIFLVAIANAYFEIFYAWARVHLKSVFGNILKELFVRIMATLLLIAVYFKLINSHQFVLCMVAAYFLQTLLMMLFAFQQYRPKFSFQLPNNFKEVIKYSLYIILAGSAATILLDIDKFMIPQKEVLEQVAFYAVAVYIGSVIEIPGRAMSQIVQPLTAKAINEGKDDEVLDLYQKTSINLIIASGFIFVLVNSNISSLYQLLPRDYTGGVWVVLMISVAKLYHMFLGNNGAIISNSKHYKILLPYGLAMAFMVVVFNTILIDKIGINGAALATLIVVLIFNTLKLLYVKSKFKIQPTTVKTWWALVLIAIFTAVGIWVKLPFHPIVNMLIESVILTIAYVFVVVKLNLSTDLSGLYQKGTSLLKK
ncbi:oligosaccharide flippase family protein [Wenyingzhuangia aestuarii]|uniref:oligosaccharide flippase family protein n=1 Tax=Wenyingzhuangia aestuarii TaxID=1647582 RepID=UPI001438E483|nr:oligosaccharide flippase family protein [Wenyingzhuangia aestuarii]NJB82579.1 O-antigen/teichoic acid export membrane protein [Wenyingzhuangia aestuarii]